APLQVTRASARNADSPQAARTAATIGAVSAVSDNSAKQALPLPLIRGDIPKSRCNCSSSVGSARYLAKAGDSMLLNKIASAGAAASSIHAASRASASAAGK